jgi:hypothetical protein
MLGVLIGMQCAVAQIEREQQQIAAAKASLTPQQFGDYMAARVERLEQGQRSATEERRHQEKCAAIRSTSFWRFGA